MEVANLTCRFGEDKVLLDLWEPVVAPAFLDSNLKRELGDDTKYFFEKVDMVRLGTGTEVTLGIVGRLIKDTVLSREQTYDDVEGLKKDAYQIESAPSSIFLFLVDTHRLLYVKETKDAPLIETFKATLLNFVRKKYAVYLNQQYEDNKSAHLSNPEIARLTRDAIQKLTPPPKMYLTPIATEDSLENFVKKFDKLQQVQIRILPTNDELDNSEFLKDLREAAESAGSDNTLLEHKSESGLVKSSVVKQVKEVANQGNHAILMKGKSIEGGTIKGDNNDFSVKAPIKELSSNLKDTAITMFNAVNSLAKDGLIKIPNPSERTKRFVEGFLKLLP